MVNHKFKKVTEPLQVKNMRVRNRIVFPATVTNYATTGGFVTEGLISYRTAIAQSVGLDIVEATTIREKGGVWNTQLCVYDDKYIPGLAKLAKAIKAKGAAAVLQIYDTGARSGVGGRDCIPFAPSKIPAGVIGTYETVELTIDGIKELVVAFAEAGRRAFEAGFDGVEIHGAHGYLISEFLSPYFNKRTDEYGGSTENRARFFLEILKAVRERVPEDFPILCRINGDEPFEGGVKIEEAKKIALLLEEAGCDIVDVSAIAGKLKVKLPSGQRFVFTTCIPFKKHKKGCYVEYARQVKKEVVQVPVMTVGKIWSLEMAERILREGKADLIAIARGLVADPEMPRKEFDGRKDEIVACAEDLLCLTSIVAGEPLKCKQNKVLPPGSIITPA